MNARNAMSYTDTLDIIAGSFGDGEIVENMTRKFAVNIMGHIVDELDKYDTKDIEELLDRQDVTDCFKPFKIFGVSVKEIPIDGPVIEKKKVSTRRVKLKR